MKTIKDSLENINNLNQLENKRCQETQKYIKSFIKFGYFETEKIVADLDDEVRELKEELLKDDKQRIFEELGDVVFVLCNLALRYEIDVEEALKYSTDEYQRRWKFIEDKISLENILKSNKQQLVELWKEAKKFKK